MKNLSLTRKLLILFLSVLLITSLFGFLAINNKTNKVVKADSPDYRLLFDYKDYHYNKSDTHYGSADKLVAEGSSNERNFGRYNKAFYISAYNQEILSDEIPLKTTASFNFKDITFHIPYESPILHFSISNSLGETYSNYTTNNGFLICELSNLKDAKYTFTFYFDYLINSDYDDTNVYFYYGRLEINSSFYIDTTPPEILFNANNTDNYFNNDKVTVNFFDETSGIERVCYSVSKTKDFPYSANIEIENGQTFTEEGNYIVVAYDKAGNKTTKYFTIDKTAPVFKTSSFKNSTSNKFFSNKDFILDWNNYTSISEGVKGNLSNANDILTVAYRYGTNVLTSTRKIYENGSSISKEGVYAFYITDKAGNESMIYVTLDKTAPELILSNTFSNTSISWELKNKDIVDVGMGKSNVFDEIYVYYSISETQNFPTSATIYENNTTTNKNLVDGIFQKVGNYTVIVYDEAENSTKYNFTIDKTAPVLNLPEAVRVKDNISYYNKNLTIGWNTTTYGVSSQRSNANDILTVTYGYSENPLVFPSTATETYIKDTEIKEEGAYLFIITDSAGNSTSYKVILDKTAPTITLNGVTPNGFTNQNVKIETNSLDTVICTYVYSTGSNYLSNDKAQDGDDYEKIFVLEGHYTLAVCDLSYNYTFYNFTIDKTAPTLSVFTEKGINVLSDTVYRTKESIYATWESNKNNISSIKENLCHANDSLTITYIYNKTTTLEYTEKNKLLTEVGFYQFRIVDRAGNEYISDLWEIYRNAPSFKIYSEGNTELNSQYYAYNQPFSVKWNNSLWQATLNGEPYSKGTVINVDGQYSFILTDELGNKNTQTLYLIRSLPNKNYNSLKSTNNRWYETTNTAGKLLAFNSYENAMKVAVNREEQLYEEAIWNGNIEVAPEDIALAKVGSTCYIYKSFAIEKTLHAYFNIATLNNAINKYAKASINEKYIPNTPPTAYEGEVIYREIYYTKNAISFNTIANCFLYVDGIEQSYPYTLTTFGEHKIKEQDIAGNMVEYTVYIDTELPIIKITNLQGNLPDTLKYGGSSYFTYGIIITLDDADKQALLKVNDTYYVGTQATLKESGIYNISVRDVAGNTGSCTIYISLVEPTLEFKIQEVGDIMNGFSVEIKKNLNLNALNYFNAYRYNTENEQWEQLTQDNSSPSVSINKNNTVYTFSVSGEYRFVLSDVFGRYIEHQYSFTKSAPVGYFYYYNNNEVLPNYSHSRKTVMFSWDTNLDCSAEITLLGGNTISYTRGSFITDEGTYRIKLYSNVDAIYSIYEITIDKTAPTGTLLISPKDEPSSIFSVGGTTQHPVSLNWTESGCTATLNGEPYSTGASVTEEGSHTIILKDRAGNENYYTFKIDTTPPTISAVSNGKQLKSGEHTRRDVLISWSESNCTCILNALPISSNHRVSIEGTYTVTLTDKYGNVASLSFTIDKTAPTGEVFINNKSYTTDSTKTIKTNGIVYVQWAEIGCTATLNKTWVYNQNDILSDNGFYSIIITDSAGNSTQFDIEIKNKPPKASLLANGVEAYTYEEIKTSYTNAITKYNVRFTWTESGCSATCNELAYSNGTTIKEEGEYTFVLIDAFGNSVVYEITIDKTAPELFAKKGTEGVIENNSIINSKALLYWEEQGASATLNKQPFENGTTIKEEGEYTIILSDRAGNTTTLTFIIDLSASAGTIISNNKVLDNGSKTRYQSYFTWTESGCSATLNGEPYSKGSSVSQEGDYFIVLTDKAGNKTEYYFTIDKTAPIGEILFTQEVLENLTSGNISFVWEEKGASATLNGEPYSKGTVIDVDGEYTFVLVDEAGNSASFYIKIDKTAPELFAKTSQNVLLNNNTTTLSDIYFTWTESGCSATLNGEPYVKETKISSTGTYILVLVDKVGNAKSMTIIIDKTTPLVDFNYNDSDKFPYLNNGWSAFWDNTTYSATLNGNNYEMNTEINLEGKYILIVSNSLGATTSYEIIVDRTAPTGEFYNLNNELFITEYSIKNFYFTWEEKGASATLNGDKYLKNSTISQQGNYRFLLVDEAGNYSVYEIFLTKEKPVLSFYSQTNEAELNSTRAYASDKIILLKQNKKDVITLNGELFTNSEPLEVGEYTFVITNEYGISATYSITIRKDAQPIETNRTASISGLFRGSSTGTVIFASTLGVLLSLAVCIPLFKGIFKRNPLKKRLK